MSDLPMKIAATGALFAILAVLVIVAVHLGHFEPSRALRRAVRAALFGGVGAMFAGILLGIWT